jgi:hypothetical protein
MAQSIPPRHPPQETEAERRARAAEEERQARDQAEAETAHLPRQGQPPRAPIAPAEAAKEGEGTVLMNFPQPVTLTMPGPVPPKYTMVHFPAGVQPVPESLASDEYLLQSGAAPVRRE